MLYVEISPSGQNRNLPFRFDGIERPDSALWRLNQDPSDLGEWTLEYNRANALYKQTVGIAGTPDAKTAFYGYICVKALIEWALKPYLDEANQSNIDVLRDSAASFGSN